MKIHYRDTWTPCSTYKGSPHIENAILQGHFTICKVITSQVSTEACIVTCSKCKELLDFAKLYKKGTPK